VRTARCSLQLTFLNSFLHCTFLFHSHSFRLFTSVLDLFQGLLFLFVDQTKMDMCVASNNNGHHCFFRFTPDCFFFLTRARAADEPQPRLSMWILPSFIGSPSTNVLQRFDSFWSHLLSVTPEFSRQLIDVCSEISHAARRSQLLFRLGLWFFNFPFILGWLLRSVKSYFFVGTNYFFFLRGSFLRLFAIRNRFTAMAASGTIFDHHFRSRPVEHVCLGLSLNF